MYSVRMFLIIYSNLSQEILAIDTWGAVICSLGYGYKHMLMILPTIWRPGFNFMISVIVHLPLRGCQLRLLFVQRSYPEIFFKIRKLLLVTY